MTQKHKFNKTWKFDDETLAIIASIEAKFDVSESSKRVLRNRISASGKTNAFIVCLAETEEAGAGFYHPALVYCPHRLDKRGDIIDVLEGLGIENPLDNTVG